MSLKFLHFADVHLGVENHGRLDPNTGLHTRVLDFIKSLRFTVETAIKEQVDLAIFAGDAYRTCDPNPTHQREFAKGIKALSDVGIPIVMITGNHDHPVSFGRATSIDIFSTLDTPKVHTFTRPGISKVETRSGPVQIVYLPWPSRSNVLTRDEYRGLSDDKITQIIQDKYTDVLKGFAEDIEPEHPSILAAHVAAADALYSGSERTSVIGRDPIFLTSNLANPAFDYVALGHVHRHQNLNQTGTPPVVYSGSIDRVNFGEEQEEKGFCIVTIEDKKDGGGSERLPLFSSGVKTSRPWKTSYRFIPTPARPFRTINVKVHPGEDPTQAVLQEINRHDLEDAVVRVIYDIQEERQEDIDLKAVRSELEPAFLVSSILRKPRETERFRRSSVSEDTGLEDAIIRYIENNPELTPMKPDLVSYANRLENELEEGNDPL